MASKVQSVRTTRSRRSKGCKTDCDWSNVLGNEDSILGLGSSIHCKATCPDYMGPLIFLGVIYLFWWSMFYSLRPGFVVKAGSSSTDPNNVDITSSSLYSLLFTVIVVLVVFLAVRCQRCRS